MTRAPLHYRFLERKQRATVRGWFEDSLSDDVSRWIMRYMAYFSMMYDDELGAATKNSDIIEMGAAEWLVSRLVMATVRSGIKVVLKSSTGGKVSDAVQKSHDKFWKLGMLDSQVFQNETILSVRGRSAILLESSEATKRITTKVLPGEYVWPKTDSAGAIVGYRLIWPVDGESQDDNNASRTYYQIEFSVDKETGKTVRTSGKCQVKDGELRYTEYDKVEENGAMVEVKNYLTDLTFIPVVHFDNLPFDLPTSDLHGAREAMELQARNNSDIDATARVKGEPPLIIEAEDPNAKKAKLLQKAVASTNAPRAKLLSTKIAIKRGAVIYTGAPGNRAYLLDTATLIDALAKYDTMLDETVVRNSQLTSIGAGMMSGGDWPRYESLALAMRPLLDRVDVKRMMREDKYRMVVLFSLRYAALRGFMTASETEVADTQVVIEWPDVLPPDVAGNRKFLLDCKDNISAITFLSEAKRLGLNIDSPEAELVRINAERPSFITNNIMPDGSSGSPGA